jgi:acetyl-CoA carboxylase / biotin carboxylase 1
LAALELYIYKIYQKTHFLQSFTSGTCLSEDGSDRFPWIGFEFVTQNVDAFGVAMDSSEIADRNISFSDLANISQAQDVSKLTTINAANARNQVSSEIRFAIIAVIESFSDLPKFFPTILSKVPNEVKNVPVNAIHVVVLSGPSSSQSNDEVSSNLSAFLQSQNKELRNKFIRRVSFFVNRSSEVGPKSMPGIFTFRQKSGYLEDRLFRDVEAPHAFHLDLPRLNNFNIFMEDGFQSTSGNVHLYLATPKSGKGHSRHFVRIVTFSSDAQNTDMETLFVEALDHLGLSLSKEEAQGLRKGQKLRSAANHFFVNIVSPDTVLQPDLYDTELRRICTKYWYKMVRSAVTTVELKLTARLAKGGEPLFLRLVASNPTGYVLKIDKYYEALVDGQVVFKSLTKNASKGPWDGLSIDTPYNTTEKFEIERAEALASSDTLYCYDWPTLFSSATEKTWSTEGSPTTNIPDDVFDCRELILCDNRTYDPLPRGWSAKQGELDGVMVPMEREPGKNDVGMVAWHMKLKTPEYPDGRDLVVICNDITFQAGSFGTKEDIIFFKVRNQFIHYITKPSLTL